MCISYGWMWMKAPMKVPLQTYGKNSYKETKLDQSCRQ